MCFSFPGFLCIEDTLRSEGHSPSAEGLTVCLKDVSIFQGSHGIPEAVSIMVTVILHLWKRQMLVSIAGGTISYMLLIHFIFS